jgi:lipopolysaccharide transport system ATP-binding protein
MNDAVIRVRGIGKRYQLHAGPAQTTIKETLGRALTAPLRLLRGGHRRAPTEGSFWALSDVTFDVSPGDIVGIIGPNGAGKSTLLKILSRITEPTRGCAELFGRVGSLLEVGTGFHPELSGRDNIFLNGAILGMRRREIQQSLDDIVAFAEVEHFVDMPVKHYSSGMYLRLAFAVAAHLRPDILIVDEVLAVGDAQFQQKCLRRMREVGAEGRTILFVSHNLAAVRNICNRGLVLDHGKIVAAGEINAVADQYLARVLAQESSPIKAESPNFLLDDIAITSTVGPVIKTFDPVEIRVRFTPKVDVQDPGVYVAVLGSDHQRLMALDFKDFETVPPIRAGETRELGFLIDELPIVRGSYQLEVYLKDMASLKIEQIPRLFPFEIVESPLYAGRSIDAWFGVIGVRAHAIVYGASSLKVASR